MARRPSFQFYPDDWLSDTALRSVSGGARGLWIDLMSLMHTSPRYGYLLARNGKPLTIPVIAKLTGNGAEETAVWIEELTAEKVCDVVKGAIVSRRMVRDEKSRKEYAASKANQRESVRKSNNRNKHVLSNVSQMSHLSSSSSSSSSSDTTYPDKETPTESCPATSETEVLDTPPPQVVMTFPTQGKAKAWHLTEDRLAEWEELYPALDVEHECRRALDWVKCNRPKTANGMPAFLSRWLGKATDRPGGRVDSQWREKAESSPWGPSEPIPEHVLTDVQMAVLFGDD